MDRVSTKVIKKLRQIHRSQERDELSQNQFSKIDLEQVSGILQPQLRNFDELTNGTLDDYMSCQTFLHNLPNQDNRDYLSDDHMCYYKKKYLLDQLKNAIDQGQRNYIQIIKALKKRTDSCEKKSDINGFTDDENISLKGIEQIKTLTEKQEERRLKILRYKNKKRNWQKKISYCGRSQVAEQRYRIKGRFISKQDQQSINKLIPNKTQEDLYDQKHNLDISKFHQYTNLFDYAQDPNKISKKQILNDIRDESRFQVQQTKILKLINQKKQIFHLIKKQRT